MAQSAASIVDLNEFRRRKQPPVARQPAVAPRATLPPPVWIVWVPVWIVA
jgi:hypothetical protein